LSGKVWAQAIAPDPTITPGAIRTTDVADVCSHRTSQLRHTTRERSDGIMAEYTPPGARHSDYEIDHLIPRGIGGADSDANLWPEPRVSIEPEWNAERKDQVELRGFKLVNYRRCVRESEAFTGYKQMRLESSGTDRATGLLNSISPIWSKKGLAFRSKESVNGVVGGRHYRRRTLRPGDRADPGLASVSGWNWSGPSGHGGFEDVIQI
jgi:hypothetical protein